MSNSIKDIKVTARYDLQAPSVQIFYETSSTIDGQNSLSLVQDFYPNPLPTDPLLQFRALQFTVDLQGTQANLSTATITTEALHPESSVWWLARHPQYAPPGQNGIPLASDTTNPVVSFKVNDDSISRTANPPTDALGNPIKDQGYYFELTSGSITPWMQYPNAQRIEYKCTATVVYKDGTVNNKLNLTYHCVSTNMMSGTYGSQQITAYPEPVPVGLAQQIYQAISVLQFEGSLTIQEEDCSGGATIGNVFNLVNGSGGLAEWATMNALVQSITENLDTGETSVEFGPPRNLSAGELVDLLRVNRLRVIQYGYGMRAAGEPASDADLSLGTNTPEKNSVSGTSPANPSVVANAQDGTATGAIITHYSTGMDAYTSWSNVPPANATGTPLTNSVVIKLSDAEGNSLKIQPLNICYNGIEQTVYFLCSTPQDADDD